MGDHRATCLVERLVRPIKEKLSVMAQENPKRPLETAMLKIAKCLELLSLEQSKNCAPLLQKMQTLISVGLQTLCGTS